MSFQIVHFCSSILEDHFGFYVSLVAKVLLRDQLPLPMLARRLTGCCSVRQIQRSIAILEQYNLLEFESNPRGILYKISPQRVIDLSRAPRAILIVKTLYEGTAEAIFEDILSQGRTSCSECIRRVSKCLDNMSIEKAKEDFVKLAEAQIVIRCDRVDGHAGDAVCPAFSREPDPFLMPDVILDASINAYGDKAPNGTLKRKFPAENARTGDSDEHILWRINWTRMDRFFRDELILDAIGSKELSDPTALRVVQLLLKVGEVKSGVDSAQSNPISLQDVVRYARENKLNYDRDEIDEKLKIIGKDSNNIVRRVGDSQGGLYIINYEKGIEFLCNENIESAIREKIGDKGVRIFRLLRSKGFLEEEQLEKEAMLSSKETKELCCSLMDSSFITTRAVSRTNDFAPARSFFLYTIPFPQALNAVIDFTTMCVMNVMRRRMLEREKHEYETLIDRQLKMEVILSNIATDPNFDEQTRKQQVADVEQAYMTDSDRKILEKFRRAERRLISTEIELDKVLFIFQQYQKMCQRTSIEQARHATRKGRRRL